MMDRIEPKSNNELALSEALSALRKVTGATVNDDKERIVMYLDSIEVEIDRINESR